MASCATFERCAHSDVAPTSIRRPFRSLVDGLGVVGVVAHVRDGAPRRAGGARRCGPEPGSEEEIWEYEDVQVAESEWRVFLLF